METMRQAAKDVCNMVFGLAAFHMCRYLLWLAPGTTVVANASIMQPVPKIYVRKNARHVRALFVRCYIEIEPAADGD